MARLLIVDDEKMICEEFRDILHEDGHDVDIALNGIQALKKVKDIDYDLVFLDVLMPRMEGRQVLEEIRKMKSTPVVLISGYLPPHKEKEALMLGAIACLRKPLDLNRVKSLIQNIEAHKSG